MSQLTIDTDFDNSNSTMPIKKYNYLMEKQTLKHITNIEILSNNHNMFGDSMLNILCYHVTQDSKYPFIQFGLEKMPYCNNIIPEQLILPYIKINHDTIDECSTIIIEKMNNLLVGLGCRSNLTLDSFQGVISGSDGRLYALVDISHVNIFRLRISRESPLWFSLPTEIMNIRSICNIPIDDRVTELFLDMPELGFLNYNDSSDTYDKRFPLPDAVYSGSYLKNMEFRSLFSMEKSQVYKSCGEYYYFFRLFEDAVKEGGWVRQGGYKLIDLDDDTITHTLSGIKHIDNEYGRYKLGGINRYALFPENYSMYSETNKKLSLTDDDIHSQFANNQCIIIQYINDDLETVMPDVLVKEYESAFPISYHLLDKRLLGEKYEIENQDNYMIL